MATLLTITYHAARTAVPAFLRPHYRVDLASLDPMRHPLMAFEGVFVIVATIAALFQVLFWPASYTSLARLFAVSWGMFVLLLLPASGLLAQHGIVQRGAGEFPMEN